ncbi:XrtA system polysaccharide chain length determinant [Roseococcus sp. DSY-14]|uniref:XrtA system polysaccharide chain length determinant n=1 Tax=Roseococcus sp. DSY-14 TaxID=3369650 RepID=UPI00387A8AB0
MNVPAPVLRSLKAAWRRRWPGLLLAWAACVAGWVAVYKLPNQYQSTARLYAEADAILGQTLRGIAVDGAPQQAVDLLARTLLARPNLERVVARTDLDQRVDTPAAREELLNQLARDVRIASQGRSLYAISYTDSDPRIAHAVVRTLLDLFMERAASNDRQQMQNARAFIGQQIAAYEAQLREAERRRAEFRTRYLELLPNDSLGGLSRLEAARGRLAELRGELADAVLRRDVLRRQLEAMPTTATVVTGGGGGGNPRVAQAERELSELRLRFTDQHPAVISQRNLIAELRRTGGGEGRAAPAGTRQVPVAATPQREALQTRVMDGNLAVASLERQVAAEEAEVERLEGLARSAPQLQVEFANLDRDYGALRRQYEELLTRRESLQLAGAARTGADQVRIDVVEPPTVSSNPTGPNRLLLATGVLLGGLGAGAGLVILLCLLDRGFYSLRELRDLGLPVLGGVNAVNPPRGRVAGFAFAGAALMLLGAYGAVLWRGPELVARATDFVARTFS